MGVVAADAGQDVDLLCLAAVIDLAGAEGLQSGMVGAAHRIGFATI